MDQAELASVIVGIVLATVVILVAYYAGRVENKIERGRADWARRWRHGASRTPKDVEDA